MSADREVLVMEVDQRTGARAMRECPKYSICSAALCPLDPDWQRRAFAKGDSVCHWQREAVAPGAEQAFAGNGLTDIWRRIEYTGDAMRTKHPELAKRLDAASEYRNDPEARERLREAFSKKGRHARTTGPHESETAAGGIQTPPGPDTPPVEAL